MGIGAIATVTARYKRRVLRRYQWWLLVALAAAAPFSNAANAQSLPQTDLSTQVAASSTGPPIRYVLEGIQIRGNKTTKTHVVKDYLELSPGDIIDVADPQLEAVRWRLLGTGYFDTVRLSLARGSRRGRVILVVTVEERNTFVIDQVAMGIAEGVRNSQDRTAELEPYFGLSVTERNVFGQGLMLTGATALAPSQQGFRLQFHHPRAVNKDLALNAMAFFNNAREFFGDDNVRVSIQCPPTDPTNPEPCPEEVLSKNAVVSYRRVGLSFGTGQDISNSLRYTLDWQGELVDVSTVPDAASERRGSETVPIDFAVDPDQSWVSMMQFGLIYDRRDNPSLATDGVLVRFRGDLASQILLSDYDFVRMQLQMQHWFPLPWKHVLRLGVYGGVIFGRAPFFYKFYVSDLSDLLPSRMLELNFDRRTPPSLLGTAVKEMRREDIAGRVDFEYAFPLHRASKGTRAVDIFLGGGLYFLASRRDLEVSIPGYEGFSSIPVDLTFDFGLRIDTDVGVFQIAFSNLVGFLVL